MSGRILSLKARSTHFMATAESARAFWRCTWPLPSGRASRCLAMPPYKCPCSACSRRTARRKRNIASPQFHKPRPRRQRRSSVRLWCQPREDTLLAAIDDNGVVKELPRLQTLRAELARIGRPVLLVLDSLADLFALNESLRLPVNSALKRVLGGLCRDFGATVLILAHPSKASIQDGTDYSGSTAFNNAVRQRLTLEIVKRQSGDMVEGPPPRVLRVAKSNYGPPAEKTLWFYGATIDELQRGPAISPDEERRIVLTTMLRLIDTGVRIMKSNGDGQKPKDVAQEFATNTIWRSLYAACVSTWTLWSATGYSPISKRTRTTRQ